MTVGYFVGPYTATKIMLGAEQVWPSGFDPLSFVPWHSVFWAENPDQALVDGATVAQWDDATGNGFDVTQATEANKPIYRATVAALNNKPALEFDGTNDRLITAAFASSVPMPFTMVVVADIQTTTTGSLAASGTTSTTRGIGLGAGPVYSIGYGTAALTGGVPTAGAHLLVAKGSTAGNDTLEVDGAQVISGQAGDANHARHAVGARTDGTAPFDGHIAFYGFLARHLTVDESASLLAWAQDHYGVA